MTAISTAGDAKDAKIAGHGRDGLAERIGISFP